jgi:Cupin-like domain
VDTWVPYVSLDSPQNTYIALNMIYEHAPVLLRGTPLVSQAVTSWNFEVMATAAPQPPTTGPQSEDEVEILCSDRPRNRFIERDSSKNLAAGPYYLREPETQQLKMTVKEFVQCAARWEARQVMFKGTICHLIRKNGTASSTETECLPVSGCLAGIATGLYGAIDWAWLNGLCRSQAFGPLMKVDLEAGVADGLQPAHYSLQDALLAQICGRRRVLLIPPSSAFNGMYPFPVAHPYDRYCMINLESLDPVEWPGCTQVRGIVAILRPGDVLYVPAYWFAHVQDLESESATLRFTLSCGMRPPASDAAMLRVSRSVEERVAAVEGPGAVRQWLSLIGAGIEGPMLDLGSVRGYRRAMMCQDIRDEVEEALGVGSWASLLPAMCRNRLLPTPWLNRDFREPLLLTDTPVIFEDSRTDDERRYPTLFRRKLMRDGWHVPDAISTVPIPGLNMPVGTN